MYLMQVYTQNLNSGGFLTRGYKVILRNTGLDLKNKLVHSAPKLLVSKQASNPLQEETPCVTPKHNTIMCNVPTFKYSIRSERVA
jgi:hypothetical protein